MRDAAVRRYFTWVTFCLRTGKGGPTWGMSVTLARVWLDFGMDQSNGQGGDGR